MEDFMIPCVNKTLFGIDCMGCGLQRATALFLQGEFAAAYTMYPPVYLVLLLLAVIAFNFFVKFRYDFQLKIGLALLTAVVIVINYLHKMGVI